MRQPLSAPAEPDAPRQPAAGLFPDSGEMGTLMAHQGLGGLAARVGRRIGRSALRTVVRILLTSRYAMWMGWGPELTFLYNDAYGG